MVRESGSDYTKERIDFDVNKNYYDILGVGEKASAKEIKKAYREAAKKHHPDTGGDEATFKEINEAYQVIGNKKKRKQYDEYRNRNSNEFRGAGSEGSNEQGFDEQGPDSGNTKKKWRKKASDFGERISDLFKKKPKRRAPEWDDQVFRRQSLARMFLEFIGLYNKVLADHLVQHEQVLDPDRRRENVDAVYHGDSIVSFRERESGIDYKVVDSFSQSSLKKGGKIEHYCIIQQSHGDRLYGLLKYNPDNDKREPAPIKFDKAANDRTGILNMFFIKNYTIIPGGIKYQLTIASRPITEDTIWKK